MSIETTTDERRKILEMVAAGTLSPGDAADLLSAVEKSGQTAGELPAVTDTHDTDISAIKVIGTFRALRIEGDPSIKGAVASGPHRARNENGVMVFEDDERDDEGGYILFGSPRESGRRVNIKGKINGKEFNFGGTRPPALTIRMNPDLALEIEITAGSVKVEDVRGPIDANITAGSGRFVGIHSPIQAAVEAGALYVSGIFDSGSSHLRCSAGKIRVELDEGSDVAVTARATLGKIQLPGSEGREVNWQGIGTGSREAKIGAGTGKLDLEATTGSVIVEVNR